MDQAEDGRSEDAVVDEEVTDRVVTDRVVPNGELHIQHSTRNPIRHPSISRRRVRISIIRGCLCGIIKQVLITAFLGILVAFLMPFLSHAFETSKFYQFATGQTPVPRFPSPSKIKPMDPARFVPHDEIISICRNNISLLFDMATLLENTRHVYVIPHAVVDPIDPMAMFLMWRTLPAAAYPHSYVDWLTDKLTKRHDILMDQRGAIAFVSRHIHAALRWIINWLVPYRGARLADQYELMFNPCVVGRSMKKSFRTLERDLTANEFDVPEEVDHSHSIGVMYDRPVATANLDDVVVDTVMGWFNGESAAHLESSFSKYLMDQCTVTITDNEK